MSTDINHLSEVQKTASRMTLNHGFNGALGWASEHQLDNIGRDAQRADYWGRVHAEIARMGQSKAHVAAA